jgi:hypothetical protein
MTKPGVSHAARLPNIALTQATSAGQNEIAGFLTYWLHNIG